jgi:16S rRNA (cytosine967-C5)-methyltransferase
MIYLPFRLHHLFNLLDAYSEQNSPLDLYISQYFRDNKAIGSKDRAFISENAYALVRWQGLLDYLSPSSNWEKRYETFLNLDWVALNRRPDIPRHVLVSFPKVLFDLIVSSHGIEKAIQLCQISNTPAPTTIRVNTKKITRDQLIEKWKGIYDISPTKNSPNGIVFAKRMPFFEFPEFKEGLFEVQDEGSQLLANLVAVKSKESVLDYCAGSGGKTLAFAPAMEGSGQIYLHDIRPHALQEAKKRLCRAGIQNAQVLLPDSPHIPKLKKKMDWVLVDAPCTGTGTLRRNPDMKWQFTAETLPKFVREQRLIFEKALSFVKPTGYIVYATCSLLKEENQEQMEYFIRTYGLTIEGELFQSFPEVGGMDGFFSVVLKSKTKSANPE